MYNKFLTALVDYCNTDESYENTMDRVMYNLLIRLDEKSLFETKWVCNSIFPKKTAIMKQTVPHYLMTTNTLQYMTNPVR